MEARWLWADREPPGHDLEKLDAWRATIDHKKYETGSPGLPTLTIDSGRGFWCFWKLKVAHKLDSFISGYDENGRPIIEDGPATQRVEFFGRALETAYKSDKICNPDRVARLPGTINHKTGRRAFVIDECWERTYSHEAFESEAAPGAGSPDVAQGGAPFRTWAGIERLKEGKLRNMIVEGVDRDNPKKSDSANIHTVCSLMVSDGYFDEDILAVITDPHYKISRHVLEHRDVLIKAGAKMVGERAAENKGTAGLE